ncbi:MAG: glycosyl-4,4'-diaponeurosporenoate acyltransferase [Actinobacteria bacterium]|nr:glycosyl-4,4'-diaponeurosporenoate acyltransferase [Actinomycetota bacterium]
MTTGGLVLIDSIVWASASVVIGFVCAKLPAARFRRDGWLTSIRSFEREGRIYERLRVRSWKDSLPDGGQVFGSQSKRQLPDAPDRDLSGFAIETRRAEVVHWLLVAVAPIFVLWNPPGLFVAMVAFAVVANVPCIVIQRYNRARIDRIQRRRSRRCEPARPVDGQDRVAQHLRLRRARPLRRGRMAR